MLNVLVVLRADHHTISHQVDRVETHSELTNHIQISTSSHLLDELGSSGLGDCSQGLDQILLGHTNTTVGNGESSSLLVELDANVKVVSRVSSQNLDNVR